MEIQKALRPVLRLPFRSKPTLPRSFQRTFAISVTRPDSSNSPKLQGNTSNSNQKPVSSNSDNAASNTETVLDAGKAVSSAEAALSSSSAPESPSISSSAASPSSADPADQPAGVNIRRTVGMANPLSELIGSVRSKGATTATASSSSSSSSSAAYTLEEQPWHLHVYAHKHNTHLTLTRPDRQPVISISTGNIGFRKGQRGGFDAGYQLGAYMMARIQRAGLLRDMDSLEVVFRGFGNGREALSKIIAGPEGAPIRGAITRVTDATRLKFGGTRSKAPRRLG